MQQVLVSKLERDCQKGVRVIQRLLDHCGSKISVFAVVDGLEVMPEFFVG